MITRFVKNGDVRSFACDEQSGAILVVMTLLMIAIGALGVSTITISSELMLSRITVGDTTRAYYLAESGAEYAKYIRGQSYGALPSGLFTVENGDQFDLVTTAVSNGVKVVATGIVHPGSLFETRRRITFILDASDTSGLVPVGFDYDEDGQFDDDTWNLVGLTKADIVETGPSGGETALDLKGVEGSISLDWQANPELDLAHAWHNNGQRLSYEIQMKISPFETGNEEAYGHHYMLGFSFRLYPDTNTSYGVSYFRSRLVKDNGQPENPPSWLAADLEPLRGTNLYLVLWYRDSGQFELINYQTLDVASGIAWNSSGTLELRDYSTLLLKLDEQIDGEGIRQNHILTYLQNTDIYPNWDDVDDIRWSDDSGTFPSPAQWENPVAQEHVDNRITSAGFSVDRPSEIAVHVFYDHPGENIKFFDDFAMKMDGFQRSWGDVEMVQY